MSKQETVPLLHDDFEKCDQCHEIVLIHGRGECLELDDAVYCPRHARGHMDDDEWQVRWGLEMELLNEIRDNPGLAIKYNLTDGIGEFYAVHRDGQTYEVWRRCDDEDEKKFTTYSESSLVENIGRKALVGSYVGYTPHLVSATEAPINPDVPETEEVSPYAN